MSNKRKDNKGRVLRIGESQRKDGTYDYRYTDTKNNRCSVYASTLDELRQKETEIQRMKSDGVSYAAADITVLELLERYINMKQRAVLNFIAEDSHYSQYLDEIVVLLGTGMRVSEFCGLTMADLDFEKRCIRVDHQLVWT